MSRRKLYLHVGCRKTGTSAVQASIGASVPALAAQGLGVPLEGRGRHLSLLLEPLAKVSPDGDVPPSSQRSLNRLQRVLQETPGDRLVLTLEDLAQLPAHQTRVLRQVLADYELHLVISARHWGKQVPSEWQQCVKERLLTSFPDYLQELEHRGPAADLFFRRQDVLDVIQRWGADLPPEQVHVVAVPSGGDEFRLFELFGEVLGIDPSTLTRRKGASNYSLGYEQAETLRRVNLALGDRLTDIPNEYAPTVRVFLTNRILRKQSGTPIRLPDAHLGWCRDYAERMTKQLQEAGYQIHGALDDLVPPENPEPVSLDKPSDKVVAETAVRALSDVAEYRVEQERRRHRHVVGSSDTAGGTVRRTLGKVRNRIRR